MRLTDIPFYRGDEPLAFDEPEQRDAAMEFTEGQAEDVFLSQWMEDVDPFRAYPRVFRNEESAVVLNTIKNLYGILVVRDGWSEERFVYSLDHALSARLNLSTPVFEKLSAMYDRGDLAIQRRQRSRRRR